MSEYHGPERRKRNILSAKTFSKDIKITYAIITLIFFLTTAGFAWLVTDIRDIANKNVVLAEKHLTLAKENENRIDDIQVSRVSSCRQTYNGIHDVFLPFFPPQPRTAEQAADVKKFNDTIERLRNGCTKQTKPKGNG